ncbi:MAG TPA: T9SS type A sorting domain-containing protein [Ignavibacteria bacterium]|nr:T9SS type A sorting domain-containing protein [Ignavibacteria bacterium]
MKKLLFSISFILICAQVNAQLPPPPPLQAGESWTNLWSVAYDFQTNGSLRYLLQDPNNPNQWCSLIMAQKDSNSTGSNNRYVYYSYSTNNGVTWFSDALNTSVNGGFPCITLRNGTVVVAIHDNTGGGSKVYQDVIFGGFAFTPFGNLPVIGGSQPIWPHIAGTSNGNLIVAASPNDGVSLGYRTTFNGSSWSSYTEMPLINGSSGNFDAASGPNGKAVVIGTAYDLTSAMYKYESTNNGISFDSGNLVMNYILDGGDTLFANVIGGYQSVYDNQGNIHIVFAAYNYLDQLFGNSNTIGFVKPRIYHWSSLTNSFTQIAGKSNIPALVDTLTHAVNVPLGQPTITITPSGKLICAFTTFLNGNAQIVENGNLVNAGEIFISTSENNGATWSPPVNITNTPGIEEKHPSLSPYSMTEDAGIYYVRDMRAGGWVNVPEWGKAPVYGIFNIIRFNVAPLAPVLLNPPDNSNYVILTPLLEWLNVFTADNYNIQLASDTIFNNPIINQTTSESEFQVQASALNYDSVYYWRVNATNSFGTGSWSPIWKFSTETFLPPAPVLVAPVNGDLEVSLNPTLDWAEAPTALSYNLQLSADSNFLNPIVNQMNLNVSQYLVTGSPLTINTAYYWRVKSNNTNGTGPWSQVFRFTTISLPLTPVLVSPPNGVTGIPFVILLNWSDVSNAQRYRILLSTDSNFTSLIVNDSGLTVSQFATTASIMTYGTKYFWKVNAINQAGNGPYSAIWNFTTVNTPPPPAPILIFPANGAVNVSVTPTLDWENVSGAFLYSVQVSTDVNFASLIVDQSELSISEYTVPSPILTTNTLYFWRASATNTSGAGSWSAAWNFRTTTVGISLISEQIPTKYGLFNNYPNPFNPSTKIKFNIPEQNFTDLKIFDMNGKEVANLLSETIAAGSYELEFTADKYDLSSGIYFYRLESGEFSDTKRMILLK